MSFGLGEMSVGEKRFWRNVLILAVLIVIVVVVVVVIIIVVVLMQRKVKRNEHLGEDGLDLEQGETCKAQIQGEQDWLMTQ